MFPNLNSIRGILTGLIIGFLYQSPSQLVQNLPTQLQFETCLSWHVRSAQEAATQLDALLRDQLMGQPLVREGLVNEIRMHLKNKDPTTALLLSLHGWPGCGKSFTAGLIAKAMYTRGDLSRHVKFFTIKHFPDPKKVKAYKKSLQKTITKMVTSCPYSLFVFDEVEKMPCGLLDVIEPLVSYPGSHLDGVNYKHAVFIFLGNSGADYINNLTYTAKLEGKKRKSLEINEFQLTLPKHAQAEGGWKGSQLITLGRIKYYLPYLPLERRHVVECFRRLAKDYPEAHFEEDDFEEFAEQMTYGPADTKVFSETGCKRVEAVFSTEVAKQIKEKSKWGRL